ncbi:MAG TPA: helix-turn-helix transcriptional regulator [Bryobacteraceae bacterium]|nr:helix-turn-helix transcriptional regulator [Bryobacteraceae bacterium]
MRQNRLAQMLNVDETTLSKIVNGFREPSEDLKRRIAELLSSDAAWLFEAAVQQESAVSPAVKAKSAGEAGF